MGGDGGAGLGGGAELADESVEAEPDVHFTPVVRLPDAVALVSGEEDEDVVFQSRVKLYRFDAGQWKERGVGDLKILKHRLTGLLRRYYLHLYYLYYCLYLYYYL